MYYTVTPWGRAGFKINKIPERLNLVSLSALSQITSIKNYILANAGERPEVEVALEKWEEDILSKISESSESVKSEIPKDDISSIKELATTCKENILSETHGLQALKESIENKNAEKTEEIGVLKESAVNVSNTAKQSILMSLQTAIEERGYYEDDE